MCQAAEKQVAVPKLHQNIAILSRSAPGTFVQVFVFENHPTLTNQKTADSGVRAPIDDARLRHVVFEDDCDVVSLMAARPRQHVDGGNTNDGAVGHHRLCGCGHRSVRGERGANRHHHAQPHRRRPFSHLARAVSDPITRGMRGAVRLDARVRGDRVVLA